MDSTDRLPHGFRLAGVACGLKTISTTLDLGLVVSDRPAAAAGAYTKNLVCAAPVHLDRRRTPSDSIRAIIMNSGNANACTGQQGFDNALQTTELVAAELDLPGESVLTMSTGIIGHQLDMGKLACGIRKSAECLSQSEQAIEQFARAMMTTDTVPKVISQSLQIDGTMLRLLGFAKGSGMIAPQLATMLAVILTDAPLNANVAQQMLRQAADVSFNAISVDGHTSTNDTVLLLANGAAVGNRAAEPWKGPVEADFAHALTGVCVELARAIVEDGEGATHRIEIRVNGTPSDQDAATIARAVANSPLVKTAIAGCDPNWGRIVSAAGYAGIPLDPQQTSLRLNGSQLFARGEPAAFSAAAVSRSLRQNPEVLIELTVGNGPGLAVFWTCDLTAEYVRINADYHT
jgi:glutamate N-acetyltransferase/amino-acid N-acetyltransferase